MLMLKLSGVFFIFLLASSDFFYIMAQNASNWLILTFFQAWQPLK